MSAKPPVWLETVSRPVVSQAMRKVVQLRPPAPVLHGAIRAFSAAWGVDLQEAARPASTYTTFQEFFTRTLRPGLRPIAAERELLPSPSDGRLSACGPLGEGRLVQAKGVDYALDALVGDREEADAYRFGTYAVVYLAPNDYHRVHCPWQGVLTHWRYVPGALYPVNRLGLANVPGLFARNERFVAHFSTEFGRAALIMVGATFVGHMRVMCTDLATNEGHGAAASRADDSLPAVERGDEFGVFEMGSTVVLLLESEAWVPAVPLDSKVRMGQALLRRRMDATA